MEINYSPQLRIERIITICRIVIVTFSIFAVLLDPLAPLQNAALANRIMAAYLGYLVLLWPSLSLFPLQTARIGIVTHIIDIVTFSVLVFITEGVASPFFSFFIFTLFCGALRWQQRGALWTALAFLCPFLGLGISAELLQDSSDDQTNRLIIRSVHLIVIASLLIYLTTYERHLRKELGLLADWPSKIDASMKAESFLLNLLLNAARVMNAPRLLMIWDEQDDSLRQIAYLQAGELHTQFITSDIFEPLVPPDLGGSHFLCKQAGQPHATVLLSKASERQSRSLSPLHPDLIQRFAIRQVIGLNLSGQRFHGWLFVLDKAGMLFDDLTLGKLLAHQIASLMDQRLAITDLKIAAAGRERLNMARDLHDGLLQTLTGIALRIETLRRLFDRDSAAAKAQLDDLQKLIVDEQRDLRTYIARLKPPTEIPDNHQHNPAERMHRLAETIQQLWGIKVTLTLPPADSLQHLPEGLYNAVREGLINSARHAGATNVRVTISIEESGLRIFVSDNGKGFHFQGSYDLAALRASGLGPKSLMDRIDALQGQLTIDSGASGAKLTMSVPLPDSQSPAALSSKASSGAQPGQNLHDH